MSAKRNENPSPPPLVELCQLLRSRRTVLIRRITRRTGCRIMTNGHEIQYGVYLCESYMEVGSISSRQEATPVQIGALIKLRIQIRIVGVQGPASHERFQARIGHRLRLEQMDVKTVFLHEDLHKDVYMSQ